jgi:hypothetical protein
MTHVLRPRWALWSLLSAVLLIALSLAMWLMFGDHSWRSSPIAATGSNGAKHSTALEGTWPSGTGGSIRHYSIDGVKPDDGPIETDEMPNRIPADGVAVWSHVVPFIPRDGVLPDPLPTIHQMLRLVPSSYPTISQIESEGSPADIFEPILSPPRGILSASAVYRNAAKIDESSALRESSPLLAWFTEPFVPDNPPQVAGDVAGRAAPVYVIVMSSGTPIETPTGCSARPPQLDTARATSLTTTSPCPFTFATHHVMILDAYTASFLRGFFTP